MNQDSETIEFLKGQITFLNRQLEAANNSLSQANANIEKLTQVIKTLEEKVKELTIQLHKDSHNSSKPPSSDGLKKKPKNKSLRKNSEKKVGGQVGHQGNTLEVPKKVDEIQRYYPITCQQCQNFEYCKQHNAEVCEKRYNVDIVVTVHNVEHDLIKMTNCMLSKEQLTGEFPKEIKSPIQYGPNLSTLIVTLNNAGTSCDRIHQIIGSAFGIPLSVGTVVNKIKKCSRLLTPTLEKIKNGLIDSKVVNHDETGVRSETKTQWVHSSSNESYTYLTLNKKRGIFGIEDNGVIQRMKEGSISVHDCWPPYWYFKNVKHAICCQHLQRELTGLFEDDPKQQWSKAFLDFLLEMKEEKERLQKLGKSSMKASVFESYSKKYDSLIEEAIKINPMPEDIKGKRGRKKKGTALALALRLQQYKDATMMFVTDFDVPFTNNTAEQSCRCVKVKSKNAGCFRSDEGAKDYLRIRSFIDTARKQGKNMFESIKQVFLGNLDYIFSF